MIYRIDKFGNCDQFLDF